MTDEELKIKVNDHFQAVTFDMPEFSKVDSYLTAFNHPLGTIDYWIERKVRNSTFNRYPDAIVDYQKWDALLALEHLTQINSLIAYGWSCGTWGFVQPSRVKLYMREAMTPRMTSVSLNKGVTREVVRIDNSEFRIIEYGNRNLSAV